MRAAISGAKKLSMTTCGYGFAVLNCWRKASSLDSFKAQGPRKPSIPSSLFTSWFIVLANSGRKERKNIAIVYTAIATNRHGQCAGAVYH